MCLITPWLIYFIPTYHTFPLHIIQTIKNVHIRKKSEVHPEQIKMKERKIKRIISLLHSRLSGKITSLYIFQRTDYGKES